MTRDQPTNCIIDLLTSPVPIYWIQYSCMDPQTKGVILVCSYVIFCISIQDNPKGGHGKLNTKKDK